MPVRIICPACRAGGVLKAYAPGQRIHCPKCKHSFVPSLPSPAAQTDVTSQREAGWWAKGATPDPRSRTQVQSPRSMRPVDEEPLLLEIAEEGNSRTLWLIGGIAAGVLVLGMVIGVTVWAFTKQPTNQVDVAALPSERSPTRGAPENSKPITVPKTDSRPPAPVPEPAWPRPTTGSPGGLGSPAPPSVHNGRLPTDTLRFLKDATVFIKVRASNLEASGSGFVVRVDGQTGYVITNDHVVNPVAETHVFRSRLRPPRMSRVRARNVTVSAVFRSGQANEASATAEVLATDPDRDLAVLKVEGVDDLPKPIDLSQKAELVETMPVYILGFPFGQALALRQGNPVITVNKGSISSLREDQFHHMKAVQIDGAINPGNSGGPVVDEQGRLVGIAVATIKGAGIGLAIAPDELRELFQGRAGQVQVRHHAVKERSYAVDVDMKLIDPMKHIRAAFLLYQIRQGPVAKLERNSKGKFDALPDSKRLDLHIDGQRATGTVTVTALGDDASFIYQAGYVGGDGLTHYTQLAFHSLSNQAVVERPVPRPMNRPPNRPGRLNIGAEQPIAPNSELKIRVVDLPASDMPRCLVWSTDGSAFFVADGRGVVHRIGLADLKEQAKLASGGAWDWLTMSREGLVAASSTRQQVWVLDPVTLERKRRINVPKLGHVASAPSLSFAYASGAAGAFPGDAVFYILDLKRGRIRAHYQARNLGNSVGFEWPTVTPDGKYLFTMGGLEQLHRFRINVMGGLVLEESSDRLGSNRHAIEVSPDSKWVCVPAGGGNPGAGNYSTYIFPVRRVRLSSVILRTGAYPQAVGFDPKRHWIYGQNFNTPLMVFSDDGMLLKNYRLPGAGQVRQFLVHPDGGKVVLLTDNKLLEVTILPEK